MPNPNVLINFVLDGSGSMWSHRDATIEGFNSFIEDQRNQPGEAFLSLTVFDTTFRTPFVGTPLHLVAPLGDGDNPYSPTGGTALLDAVGSTIKGTERWLEQNPGFSGRVVCVVMTDGEENSSRSWHINQPTRDGDSKDVAGLIKYKQAEGWEFVFLGAGGSGWLERAFGHVIDPSRILWTSSSDSGHRSIYAASSAALSSVRTDGGSYNIAQSDLVTSDAT